MLMARCAYRVSGYKSRISQLYARIIRCGTNLKMIVRGGNEMKVTATDRARLLSVVRPIVRVQIVLPLRFTCSPIYNIVNVLMPFSHHSHSGQFCKHAKGTLEEVVQEAIRKGFKVFALTEHVPRYRVKDLYPEEVDRLVFSCM